jgi:hypothetical protein
MYNHLPEDEPLEVKHVEDIINQNISSEKVHFAGLYCIGKYCTSNSGKTMG